MKKLVRKTNDKKISGVLAGFAEYLNIDVTILRLLFAVGAVISAGAPFIIIYIVAALVMPEEGKEGDV
ncbi:PspC domain-containing protein [Bacillus carboniphilus]|uniref:PspC domain-containing protein n=1 Tax=Bacillus carboniphilus TaxID=86663 RepID=A0ABY9JRV4_9BACI|nr:PspC domain-containing protein [Bacillus carboniphilus]WLR41468.1 PspC domain-containing protein [Bacillus carboniphilus]